MLACTGGVRLENGVYEDLVVALDPTMESNTLDLTQLRMKFEVGKRTVYFRGP